MTDFILIAISSGSGLFLADYCFKKFIYKCSHSELEVIKSYSGAMETFYYKHKCKQCGKVISYNQPAHTYRKNSKG